MKKKFQVFVNDERKLIVDVEGRFVSVGVMFQPVDYASRDGKAIVSVRGMKKENDRFIELRWPYFELQEDQSVVIKYDQSTEDVSDLPSEQKLNDPEPRCIFCDRSASEVETLIERNDVAKICASCVDDCVEAIRSRQPDP